MRAPLELGRVIGPRSTVLTVVGELDCSTAPLLSDLVEDSARACPELLVLDLSGCTFLDSGGCRTLAVAHRLVGHGKIGVACPGSNRSVRRVLDMVGLSDALDVRERIEDFGRPEVHDQPA